MTIDSILQSPVVVAVVVGSFGALTVWWGLRRFRSKRSREREAAARASAIEILHELENGAKEFAEAERNQIDSPPERLRDSPAERLRKLRHAGLKPKFAPMNRYTFAIYDEDHLGDAWSQTLGEHLTVELIDDHEARSYGLYFARDLKRASPAAYRKCAMAITAGERKVSVILFDHVD